MSDHFNMIRIIHLFSRFSFSYRMEHIVIFFKPVKIVVNFIKNFYLS
jgi:hypothetical protein